MSFVCSPNATVCPSYMPPSFIFLSEPLSVCLFVLSVCLSVRPSVCLFSFLIICDHAGALSSLFLDFDECAANFDNCDPNAYCNNTVGSFNCTCNSGYTGNGTTCTGKYDFFSQ